jgi:S1-C subfamily serine protease
MVRAFALDAEHATQVWSEVMAASGGDVAKQAPNVLEPDVEIATKHGFGVVIGKGGLVAIDPTIVKKGFKSLVIHHDGKDYPATLFSPKDKDGGEVKTPDVQLVTCEVPLEAARIGAKKAAEVGQNVFAISYELNTGKKGFYSKATVTRGIVSRFGSNGSFQHDARLSPENPGGYLVGEKGDVFGFFFQTQTSGGSGRRSSSDNKPTVDGLGTCVSTQAISAMLEKIPGQGVLRTGAATEDMEANGKALLASSVLVVATFEINKPRKITEPKVAAPAATMPPGGDPPPTGWSLSKAGVRHSSKCQYYNAQYPCQATEGRPCKVCGG